MKSNLPTPYQNFIHKSRYARWDDSLERRETWEETVDRYLDYITEHVKKEYNFDIERISSKQVRGNLKQRWLYLFCLCMSKYISIYI